jgi:hypothetical protein
VLLAQSCYREAIDKYQRDLSLNPGMIPAYNGLATSHNYLGEPELALAGGEGDAVQPARPLGAKFLC